MHGGRAVVALLTLLALGATVSATPTDPGQTLADGREFIRYVAADPGAAAQNPSATLNTLLDPQPEAPAEPGAPERGTDPGFADRIRDAFDDELMTAGIATLAASLLGLAGFALVTRYISPKEALRNPQRAMLYGFVRGNPGVHLKKLSEEFAMKTSSILWHIRKLESAELVRSERANGYRVFYPVEGGMEIRKVSRAITALQNGNARALYEAIEAKAGASPTQLATRLSIHSGTVRWHLRKLRDFGLVEELLRAEGSTLYPTPLGRKALHTLLGAPAAAPAAAPVAFAMEA